MFEWGGSTGADPQMEARSSGFSWGEIWDHISSATTSALGFGYTQKDVDQHLGFSDPEPMWTRAVSQWADTVSNDAKVMEDATAAEPTLDLTASPTVLNDYAEAMKNREVKGPRDFTDAYAGAAMTAMHDLHGAEGEDADLAARQRAAGVASAALVPYLPTNEDLTDATIGLSDEGTDPEQVRNALIDHWRETGEHPLAAAMKAQTDPALSEKLKPSTWTPPTLEELSKPGRDAIEKFYFVPGEELVDAKTAEEALVDLGIDIATVAGLSLAGKYIVGPLARAAVSKAKEIPEWLSGLMARTKTETVDLTKPPGAATGELSVADAMRPPEPAAFEPVKAPVEGAAVEPPKFVETATPAEKIERIAQDAILPRDQMFPPSPMPNNRVPRSTVPAGQEDFIAAQTRRLEDLHTENFATEGGGTFFQRRLAEMGETDPATVALARGHDTTASASKWFSQVFGDLLRNESGAGPGLDALAPGSRRARIEGKNYADELIRSVANGLGTQRSEHVAQGFEQFFKDLSPYMPRWRQELAKPNGGDAMNTEIGRMVNAIEGKGTLVPDSPLAPYVRHRAEQNDIVQAELKAAVDRGELNEVQFRDYYLAHMYTPESIGSVSGAKGTGRQGNMGFTRERSLPTYEDAFAEGYKPLYDNPLLMDMASLDTKRKVLATVSMQATAKDANWMRYYTDPREAVRDGFRPLTGLNSEKLVSTVNADGTPGPVVRHQLYGAEGFDKIWNNWVGWENMQRNPTAASIEDAMLKIKNTSTYLKLMFPGYHTITEYKNGMANGIANAVTELSGGEIGRGLWDLAKVPIKPIEYVWKARAKYRPMYRAMEADPALDAFVAGGGNLAARSKVYAASDSPTLWKLWQRGQLTDEIANDLNRSFTAPAFRGDPGLKTAATDLTNLATFPFREISRVATSLSAPLWDHGVPLLKGGAAIERLQTYIRQNPTASDDAIRNFARHVVTNIEDRMGEYNSANLFWPTIVKRAANQSMLSTGWTYGTIHATLTGMGWEPGRGMVWNPTATTNLAAQLATVAFTNAAWSYLIDGKLPTSTLDYMIPFANARGIARILLPGEEKEYYDWMKIAAETYSVGQDKGVAAGLQQFFQSTGAYAKGKAAPIWQAAHDWMTGTDAIGHKIAYTPGGIAGWLGNEFLPIFATNAEKAEKIGLNPVENAFGLKEGPKWLSNWDAWRGSQERLHNRWTVDELRRVQRESGVAGATPQQESRNRGENAWRTGQSGGAAAAGVEAYSPGRARQQQRRMDAMRRRLGIAP